MARNLRNRVNIAIRAAKAEYIKGNRAIFPKPQKSMFLNPFYIWLKYTMIYGQFISKLENHMSVLFLEIQGVKHKLYHKC